SSVFTNGIEIGLARNESHDLRTATDELIQSLQQSNPRLERPDRYDATSIDGRRGLHAVVSNVSDATGGQEVIDVYTASLADGSLFYVFGVAPHDTYPTYSRVFASIVRSIQFAR